MPFRNASSADRLVAGADAGSAYETLIQFLYRAPIGLIETRLDGTVEMINPMAANLLMPLAAHGGLDNLFDALESVAPQLRRMVSDFDLPSGEVCESVRISIAGAQGTMPTQVLSISLLKLDDTRLMATLADATADVMRERRGLERRLDAALRIDILTRMPNRAAVRDLIDQAMARRPVHGEPAFAVLFMNCDRFRQINDALGHAAGDEVLGLMADRVRSTLRQRSRSSGLPSSEQMAGRIGGDEFVIVLDDLRTAEDVHMVTQRLLDVLGQPYSIRAEQLHCSVSIGIVLQAQISGAADADSVLQDASIAMIEAKRAGGARYAIFEPAMQERAARRSSVENDLRRALSAQELFVVYQPVVGLAVLEPGGALHVDRSAGVEALVRWRHPTRGIVPPLEFIGIAEECGLIGLLGEFVLATACRQFMAWQQQLGAAIAPRKLAVNLSRGQLADPMFAATAQAILESTGMPPAQLQLEVTESLAAQDETVQHRLHELKALGLTLALDDFGTGYSSLASLHLLPVDTVKIDRSFVSQAVQSLHHRVLIEATVRVAASLRMGTVAEGIETQDQAELVCQLGCEKGQGYLFARPLESDDLIRWLTPRPDQAATGNGGSIIDRLRPPAFAA